MPRGCAVSTLEVRGALLRVMRGACPLLGAGAGRCPMAHAPSGPRSCASCAATAGISLRLRSTSPVRCALAVGESVTGVAAIRSR